MILKKNTESLIVSNFINLQKKYKIDNQKFHLIEGIKRILMNPLISKMINNCLFIVIQLQGQVFCFVK